MIKRELEITPTVAELAEAFSNLDNMEMLEFFQHAVWKLNQIKPYLADYQFCWVANAGPMDQATVCALACLQRVDGYTEIIEYKPPRSP